MGRKRSRPPADTRWLPHTVRRCVTTLADTRPGMRRALTIAVAQPACIPHDLHANGSIHARAVRYARTRIVVFPELSLTGYELEAAAVDPGDLALEPIVRACRESGSTALVGAPVAGPGGQTFIAMLAVGTAGVSILYRKRWLGDEEGVRFTPGDEPTVLDVDGWRVGVGICKDTGMREHVERMAELGIDTYCAGLVHLLEELGEQEERAVSIARRCGAFVAFASFAGPTGGGYSQTAGSSTIWTSNGQVLSRAGTLPGEIARATLEPD
jgi:predicted amidohydrolase